MSEPNEKDRPAEHGQTEADSTEAPAERDKDARAEEMLEEGKRRLEETLEGDLNATLGE